MDASPPRKTCHHGCLATKTTLSQGRNTRVPYLADTKDPKNYLCFTSISVCFTPLRGILLGALETGGEESDLEGHDPWGLETGVWIFHNKIRDICRHLVHAEFWI